MNQRFESETEGTFHYNLHIPDDYDGSKPYALHIALPGWEGLFFQGIGEDLYWEYLPHESSKYVSDLIVVSVQLNDWGLTSVKQTISLTEWMMSEYNIDSTRMFITDYSGGGETLSHSLALRPELYTAALFVSSQGDSDPTLLVETQTPLYLFTADHDTYYGFDPVRKAYQEIHDLYIQKGLTEDAIDELLIMDIRSDEQMDTLRAEHLDEIGESYTTDYHTAGMLAAFDENIMHWVFHRQKNSK